MLFAIFVGQAIRVFFENAGKMALRREAEIGAYCDGRLIGIEEEAFCFLDFFFQDKISKGSVRFFFEFNR